jgi:hypothetical protein
MKANLPPETQSSRILCVLGVSAVDLSFGSHKV